MPDIESGGADTTLSPLQEESERCDEPLQSNSGDDQPDSRAYKVGYKSPPREHRFQKGQAGNRKGRPRKSRNLVTIIGDIADETITVREGGKSRKMRSLEVMARSLFNRAMKGDAKATTALLPLLDLAKRLNDPAVQEEEPLSLAEQAILDEVQRLLREKTESDDCGLSGEG